METIKNLFVIYIYLILFKNRCALVVQRLHKLCPPKQCTLTTLALVPPLLLSVKITIF